MTCRRTNKDLHVRGSQSISTIFLTSSSSRCAQALDVFVIYYGAEAGNLALKMMAAGGVFIGGGIAPVILPHLERGEFLNAFLSKGRMRHLLEARPVRVILNPKTALLWRGTLRGLRVARHHGAARVKEVADC